MLPHPEEVARDQGYYEHRAPPREEPERASRIPDRVRDVWRLFWLAAGVVAAALIVGLFVWIWIGSH